MGNINEKIVVGEKKSDAERDKCSKEERDVWYKLYRIGLTRITCSFSLNNGDVGNVHLSQNTNPCTHVTTI